MGQIIEWSDNPDSTAKKHENRIIRVRSRDKARRWRRKRGVTVKFYEVPASDPPPPPPWYFNENLCARYSRERTFLATCLVRSEEEWRKNRKIAKSASRARIPAKLLQLKWKFLFEILKISKRVKGGSLLYQSKLRKIDSDESSKGKEFRKLPPGIESRHPRETPENTSKHVVADQSKLGDSSLCINRRIYAWMRRRKPKPASKRLELKREGSRGVLRRKTRRVAFRHIARTFLSTAVQLPTKCGWKKSRECTSRHPV